MLEAVPSSIKNGSRRRRKYFARATNSLLLLLIFYGGTWGLVHSHAIYLPSISTLGTVLNDAREGDLTAKLLPSGKNCLLCQFHQQLSHGLFHTTPFALQPTAGVARRLAANFANYSAPHESLRGRAPPFASLL
ncbi:MAG TPA: hypothetical protein VGX24_01145 [Pyrinomonadaceae bacterium]|jgi:hypothetical protein|nr:hypothetical protein [Pyrinomonadaceae bacterium]